MTIIKNQKCLTLILIILWLSSCSMFSDENQNILKIINPSVESNIIESKIIIPKWKEASKILETTESSIENNINFNK